MVSLEVKWAAGGCPGFLLNLGNLYSLTISGNPTKKIRDWIFTD